MTPEESSWENEGGFCRPEPGQTSSRLLPRPGGNRDGSPQVPPASVRKDTALVYNPACTSALKPWELVTLRLLAEEFFGSLQALEDGNLEGLEMAETQAFDYEPAMPAGARS